MPSSFRAWRARLDPPRVPERLAQVGRALLAGAALGGLFGSQAWSWLAPLPLAWLFSRVAASDARGAFRLAFAFALAFFAVHLAWLPASFAQLFGPLGALPFPPLVALLALSWGVTAGLTRLLAGPLTLVALPFAWALLEWARGLGPLGFTWGSLGYALGATPLAQAADLGGVPLLSLLVGLAASALALLAARPAFAASVAGAWLLALGYGAWRQAAPVPGADVRVLLVQGSVSPLEKATGQAGNALDLYERLTREGLRRAPADLVIWPETASPLPLSASGVLGRLAALGAPLLLGAPTLEWETQYNSAYAVSGGALRGRQDKRKLVPFGEFFPGRAALAALYDPVFSALGVPGLASVTPGRTSAPLPLGRVRAGTLICYESTFPALSRALVRKGANVLVVISNDAWFGRSAGAEQHFQMGRLRAIETRRYLARAGNDGITAVIDPRGKVVARFPRGVRAAFAANFGLSEVTTPYVRFGDWPVALSALTLLALIPWRNHGPRRVSNR